MRHLGIVILIVIFYLTASGQYSVNGLVVDNSSIPISGARITLFDSSLTYFAEKRSDNSGLFIFNNIPAGNYSLGVEKLTKEYLQQSVTVPMSNQLNITLQNEMQTGVWTTIIQAPEALGGTNLGILMPNGRIFYCHSTKDPFYFDPSIDDTIPAIGDTSVLGCTGPLLMPNGLIIMAGGTLQEVYGPGCRRVKTFDYLTSTWVLRDSLFDYRWYPTVTKLADNRLLIFGGGNLNNPQRTNTSEIYDPSNWTTQWTDTIAIGDEVSPNVLLYNGKVLMTHRPPQLFNPLTMQWDSAGQFVQGPRTPNGDHSDHELVLLSNGDALAIGYKSFTGNLGTYVERYNPSLDSWSLGSSISPIRSRVKTVLLPNEKILAIGGYKEDMSDTTMTNQWGYMNLCDEYSPVTDTWRRLSRLNLQREYHCNSILVPDGRVIAVGGEGQPGNEPPFSYIEGFKPPYLFRGIRPVISNLSTTNFQRGLNFTFDVSYTDSLTDVILISTQSVTHFMNTGNNRFVHLNYLQSGTTISASIPNDSLIFPDGFYMLFAMVDDIPGIAKIISVVGNYITNIIEPIDFKNITIFPNPSNNSITITNSSYVHEIISVSLVDLAGKVVKEWRMLNKIETISTNDLPAGSYLVNFKSEKNSIVKKIIIVR